MLQVDFAVDMNYSKSQLNVIGTERELIQKQIQKDYVKADIYFKSLNVQTITQNKKYTVGTQLHKKFVEDFMDYKNYFTDGQFLGGVRWLAEPLLGHRGCHDL